MKSALLALLSVSAVAPLGCGPNAGLPAEYHRRVSAVTGAEGFVALWDFVNRRGGPGGNGQFIAYSAPDDRNDYALEAQNYAHVYWSVGRPAKQEDFSLLGRGPFGQAVYFAETADKDFTPALIVSRGRLHDRPLDIKGPGASVSMVAWVIRESGNHAIAGIWHEGNDLRAGQERAAVVEHGRRQYALFAGLAANTGASAAHISENGRSSFGDKYARNLSVTPGLIPAVGPGAGAKELDAAWTVVGFSFDNDRDTVTSYLDGKAEEFWIDNPAEHPFYKWPYNGWKQAQPGGDGGFPKDQYYRPPEDEPLSVEVLSETGGRKVVVETYEFTKVRVTSVKDAQGEFAAKERELVGLKANPYWFGHDIYAPATEDQGGPFSIGKFLTSNRGLGMTGYVGGVAVFDRALSAREMEELASIGKKRGASGADLLVLREMVGE